MQETLVDAGIKDPFLASDEERYVRSVRVRGTPSEIDPISWTPYSP
jgi:hypothetical protein